MTMKILSAGKTAFLFSSMMFMFFMVPLYADSTYRVEKGDTLYSISRKYQITVAELRAANNLSDSDVLKAGQKLVIPTADIGTAAALSAAVGLNAEKTADASEIYTVQKGDTLYGIARRNGMTVPELLSLNGMDSTAVLKTGEKIKIRAPEKAASVSSERNAERQEILSPAPDTRTYGATSEADRSTSWPVKNPDVTYVKGKVSGVQLSAKLNEPVTAVRAGTVMYVGVYRGFGQVLFVQSKTGLIYAYTGMGSIKVRKGDYVVSGAELGTAGSDSITGKPQITFMVFQNGQPVDPAKAPRG